MGPAGVPCIPGAVPLSALRGAPRAGVVHNSEGKVNSSGIRVVFGIPAASEYDGFSDKVRVTSGCSDGHHLDQCNLSAFEKVFFLRVGYV